MIDIEPAKPAWFENWCALHSANAPWIGLQAGGRGGWRVMGGRYNGVVLMQHESQQDFMDYLNTWWDLTHWRVPEYD